MGTFQNGVFRVKKRVEIFTFFWMIIEIVILKRLQLFWGPNYTPKIVGFFNNIKKAENRNFKSTGGKISDFQDSVLFREKGGF